MTDFLQNNFIYMSQIVGAPVMDFNGNGKIGYVSDVAAMLRDMYPRVSGLIVRKKMALAVFYVPWKNVRKIMADKAIMIEYDPASAAVPSENEIKLKETFWDKQVVDVSGSKVVRVNDLHFLREGPNFWLVHMDIGFKGLLRRLGWLRQAERIFRWLFSVELKERLISWKYIQPISSAGAGESLLLKVPQTKLSELHPADLAEILVDLGTDERVGILKSLDTASAARAFKELPLKVRIQAAESFSNAQMSGIINEMPVDEAVDLIGNFSRKRANALFLLMPQERATQMKKLLSYSERSAGSVMNTEYISVKSSSSVNVVWDRIRSEIKKKESIYYLYVLDENDALVGVVTLRQLLTAPHEKLVSEVMRKRVSKVRVDTDIKDAAQLFLKYDFTVIPVVDKQNKLLGTITMKDAFESVYPVIREEVEEATS